MGFLCYRLGLIFFNIIYLIVGFALILCPIYSKVTDIFTSWSIVGGTIACGVFIMLVAAAGIYGAVKHHQIILFFFMAIMFMLFIILFSVSVAALSISTNQQHEVLRHAWKSVSNKTKGEIQRFGHCCGFNSTLKNDSTDHPSCEKLTCCKGQKEYTCSNCHPCYDYLRDHGLDKLKQAVGGIGLFFSFTMFVGIYLAFRYRHLKDPRANPSAFL